jgi:uncharacterized protein (TIGR02145 family)
MKFIFVVLVVLTHTLCAQMNLEGSLIPIPAPENNSVDIENTFGSGNMERKKFYSDKTVIPGHLTDPRDGHIYRTIRINDKIWMAEDLVYLPKMDVSQLIYDDLEYINQNDGFKVKQIDNVSSEFAFNVLYTFETAKDVCPAGWHLPDDAEWSEMEDRLSKLNNGEGEHVDLFIPFSKNISDNSIENNNKHEDYSGPDPGSVKSGYFLSLTSNPAWWTSTNSDRAEFGVGRKLFSSGYSFLSQNIHEAKGLSVRCIKD